MNQHLLDHWDTTLEDDTYPISEDGWKAHTHRVPETRKTKDGTPGKTVDKGWACDLAL